MRLELFLAGVITVGTTSVAWAQFTQYSPPGRPAAEERTTKDRLEKAMEQARWKLGPLRLEPWVGVSNLTYHDELDPWREGKQSDVTISAGAGVTAFLPVGHRLLLASYVLPEYSWWRTYTGRNQERGRYGVGAFAELGRLSLDLKGFRGTESSNLGFDEELPISVRREGAVVNAELRLLRRLFAYGGVEDTRWRYRDKDLEGAPVARLRTMDRDERRTAAGLSYRFRDRLTVSVGYAWPETDFLLKDFDRSNFGSASTLGLEYTGGRFTLSAQLSEYDLKPRAASTFQPFSGRLGSGHVKLKLGSRSGVDLYAGDALAFTFAGDDYYEVETRGVAVQFPLGWRVRASAFAESGTHTFVSGARPARDVRSFGASVNVGLRLRSNLALGWERRNYDTFGGEAVRAYNRFTAGVNFGLGSAVAW